MRKIIVPMAVSMILIIGTLFIMDSEVDAQSGLPSGYYSVPVESGNLGHSTHSVTGVFTCSAWNNCTGTSQVSGWDKSFGLTYEFYGYSKEIEGIVLKDVSTLGTGGDFENSMWGSRPASGQANYTFYNDSLPGRVVGTVCYISDELYQADSTFWDSECDHQVLENWGDIQDYDSSELFGVLLSYNVRHKVLGGGASIPYSWSISGSSYVVHSGDVSSPGDTQPVGGTGCTWVVTSTGESFASSTNAILNPSFEEGSGVPAEWRFPDGFSGWNYLENDADLANDGVKSVVYDQYLAGLPATSLAVDINLPDEYVTTTVSVPYRLGECPLGADCENGRSLAVHIGSIPVVNEIVNYDDCALLGDSLGGFYHSCGYRSLSADVDAYAGFYTFRIDIGLGSAPIWIDGVSVQASDGIAFVCIEPDTAAPDPTSTPLGTAEPLPTMGPMPTLGAIVPTPFQAAIGLTPQATRCLTVWPETNINLGLSFTNTLESLSICLEPSELDMTSNPANVIASGEIDNTLFKVFSAVVVTGLIGWIRFR